jgi:hypothetical protein
MSDTLQRASWDEHPVLLGTGFELHKPKGERELHAVRALQTLKFGWEVVLEVNGVLGAGRLRIEQTATEITMTDENAPGRVERYRIAGAESTNSPKAEGTRSTAQWQGNKLVLINGTTAASGVTNARTMTLSVTNDGKELTTETDAQGKMENR